MRKDADSIEAESRARPARWTVMAARGGFVVAAVLCVAFAFGLSARDAATLRSFADSVDRWQVNPEFRSLAAEYSVRGSEALRTRPILAPADRVIILARSCPLLPERYALTASTRLHYEDFGRGPLCAYLHLCDEQAVHHAVGMVEELGRQCRETGRPAPDAAELRAFLRMFKLDSPVVKDAGALASVSALLADTHARSEPFTYRGVVGAALGPHVRALAAELGFPADARRMTVAQQRAVLDRLDAYVRRQDPELWRTKQVSDFCAGIWAHVFGRSYNLLIKPFLFLHAAGRVGLLVLLWWAAARWAEARQEARAGAREASQGFFLAAASPRDAGARAATVDVIEPAPPVPARARPRPAGARRRRA
jgi:hypothetical protein